MFMDDIRNNLKHAMGYVPEEKEVFEKLAIKYEEDEKRNILEILFNSREDDPLFRQAWQKLLDAVAPGKSLFRG